MKKICSFGRRMLDWFRNDFVLSKTVLFIWGLILSHALVKNAVVNIFMDFLSNIRGKNSLREAMAVNLLDGLSAILVIVVMHVSQAYTSRFTVIIFCTGVYVMGLMLSWVYTLSLYLSPEGQLLSLIGRPSISISPLSTLIIALVLITLGRAGGDPILRCFLDHQLREERERSNENRTGATNLRERGGRSNENRTGATNLRERGGRSNENRTGATNLRERERSNENHTGATNLWPTTATFAGSTIAVFCFGNTSWRRRFQISSIVMGAMYILFFFGIFCYYRKKQRLRSPFTIIYMVFKAAIKRRSLLYPCSKEGYYKNNNNQGPDDSKDRFYWSKNGEVHLEPRHPSFLLFLDKAAIIRNNSDVEKELKNRELCRVAEVSAVKTLYPIVIVGFTFFAYSLVLASANTYFVQQTSNLDPRVGNFKVPIMVFFVLKSSVAFMVNQIQYKKQLVKPICSIAIGLFCSILCSVAAWLVERHRLFLIGERVLEIESDNRDEVTIPLSIMVLAPQYFLQGLMEGFAEYGLLRFVRDQVAKSMKKNATAKSMKKNATAKSMKKNATAKSKKKNAIAKSMKKIAIPCYQMIVAIGNFFSILCALTFGSWFKESINTSRMDRYFRLLALLNFVFFGIYVGYAKYKLLAQSEGQETKGESNIEISSTSRTRG